MLTSQNAMTALQDFPADPPSDPSALWLEEDTPLDPEGGELTGWALAGAAFLLGLTALYVYSSALCEWLAGGVGAGLGLGARWRR